MHILVVDDEPLARQRLIKMINSLEGYSVVGDAENGDHAIEQIVMLDPDLVLMDIKMPGKDGLDAARDIMKMSEPPAIIFCTAYDDYALDAFDTQAVGYLLKPVQQEQLVNALEKAQKTNKAQRVNLQPPENAEKKRQHISAKTRKGIELIPVESVSCLLADQKYVTVVHENGETLIDETLKELEEEFASDFLRVHRNALVAVKQIEGMKRNESGHYEVLLKGTDARPMVSRRHLSNVKSLLASL
ncbi:MAG: LytTR family DNA-binding domain-containing protein [Agarilytica sp.]